jgi:hypothetical protein
MNVLLLKETMLMNKYEFAKKNVFFLLFLLTYWTTRYEPILEIKNKFLYAKTRKILISFEALHKM